VQAVLAEQHVRQQAGCSGNGRRAGLRRSNLSTVTRGAAISSVVSA
jgi:hypothetical protein